jgi:hypothetical protein
MTNNEELVSQFFKASLILGVVMGRLEGITHDSEMGMATRQQIENLLSYLYVKIDELYYHESKKCSEPFRGRAFVAEPEKPKQQPYNKDWNNRCLLCGRYHPELYECSKSESG